MFLIALANNKKLFLNYFFSLFTYFWHQNVPRNGISLSKSPWITSLNLFFVTEYVKTRSYGSTGPLGVGLSIKYVHKIFQKTNISNPLIRTRTCAYQGVRNVIFTEYFAYVLNRSSIIRLWNQFAKTHILPIQLQEFIKHRLQKYYVDNQSDKINSAKSKMAFNKGISTFI